MSEAKKRPEKIKLQDAGTFDQRSRNTFYTGTEPFFAFFTQAQVNINGLRITFDEQVVQPVQDLASHIETVRRKLLHDGDAVSALEDVRKVATNLDRRIQSWETEAQNREQNKTKMSGENIHRMKAEFARVRMKCQLSRRTVTKLLMELHQLGSGVRAGEDARVIEPKNKQSAEAVEAARLRRRKCVEVVNPVLTELFTEDFSLNITSARFTADTYPQGREEARDPGLAAFLAVGWYRSQKTHRSGNDLDLDIWLIPKEPRFATALEVLAPEIKVDLRTPGEIPRRLEFFAMSAMSDVLPRSEQLCRFVGIIEQNSFSGKPGLKVLRAQVAFAARDISFQRLVFKPLRP